MIEQLWYTWTIKGLGQGAGFQVCAASPGLSEINSQRHRAFRSCLDYALPQGTDLFATSPEISPVTLAFLDLGDVAMPEGYSNTHIVVHKTYRGQNVYGRAGVFFAHLIDKLPQGFVASDAIDLWASTFWCVSDDPPPSPDYSLAPVQETDLRVGKLVHYESAIYPYRDVIERCLPYVIQAFLSLKPTQKLYILAPAEQVAALIWGLAHSLPRSLQKAQGLTFSTYEKEVGRSSARVVGTCRADVRALYKHGEGRAQQPLPSDAFTGSGSALALDCENNYRAPLQQTAEAALLLATYAHFATRRLLDGQKETLANFLALASDYGAVNTAAFLSFVKTHIDEDEREPN